MQYLEPQEILKVLEKAIDFGGEVERPLIFSRESYKIKKIEILESSLCICLDEELLPHEDARHIYINLHYRRMNFIIKSSELKVDGRRIQMPLPRVAKAIDERPTTRYKLEFEKYPTVVSRSERRGGNHDHVAFVDDISETGLSLIISQNEDEELLANDHLWIKSIGESKLHSPLFAKVVYTRLIEIENKKYLKAGIRLEKSFDEELFNQIIKSSIKTLAA